jgi:hypothetical protein
MGLPSAASLKVRDRSESDELRFMHKPFYGDDLAKKIGEILAPPEGRARRVPGATKLNSS